MTGIDVSHWQGKIDWSKVAKNSPVIDFAYIKASTGVGSADERALYNATEAKKNGIKIGYYHYCSLNDKEEIEDAKEEAKWLARVLSKLPVADLPIALDIEDSNPTVHLSDDEVVNFINAFFTAIKSYGMIDYVLYSYKYFLDDHLPANHTLGNIRLWLASYSKVPKLPVGWDKKWMWQYTDSGIVKGINTKVDMNKQ